MKQGKNTSDWIIECSGRSVYANCGIFGLGPETGCEPTEGFDGVVNGFGYDSNPWTSAERKELAMKMIKRWRRFGNL